MPIASIEKFLFDVLYRGSNKSLKKRIGDKFFHLKSIEALIAEFNKQNPNPSDKGFYRLLVKDLKSRKIEETTFIENLCVEIEQEPNINTVSFAKALARKIG